MQYAILQYNYIFTESIVRRHTKRKRPQAFACDRFGYLSGRHADGAGDLLVGLIRDPAFSLQQQRHRQSACQLPSWRCQRLR